MAVKSKSVTKKKDKGLPAGRTTHERTTHERTPNERKTQERTPNVRTPDVFRTGAGRLFDEFFTGFGLQPFAGLEAGLAEFTPRIDMTEDDKAIHVNAELPGIDEKDIDITLTTNSITITGEKREETESKEEDFYCSERSYGVFRRVLPVEDVDLDKAKAVFRKGVLKVTLPKVATHGRAGRKVEVKVT